MLKDIHFQFTGFHGTPGRCQIRIARHEKNKPLVFVCSQYKKYYGTSVTNALEIIVNDIFYQIASREIDGVSFDKTIIIDEWQDDASYFDKLLSKLNPNKYKSRFSARRLDIQKIFSNIVWIEYYSDNSGPSGFGKNISVVTLDEDGSPNWHGWPKQKWLEEKTGFQLEDLLPNADSLDLEHIEPNIEWCPPSQKELQSIPGYQHVYWTRELLRELPGMLSAARTYTGRSGEFDLEESAIHAELAKFFSIALPARELFARDFSFSKQLEIYSKGMEKAVDIAIFDPGLKIDSLIEVKRTSSKTSTLKNGVLKDIARLLLLSKKIRCSCYLLVCGDVGLIEAELAAISEYISLNDGDGLADCKYIVNPADFDKEYSGLLSKFEVKTGGSRLQGRSLDGKNAVMLWQISAAKDELRTHRPYEFNLTSVGRH